MNIRIINFRLPLFLFLVAISLLAWSCASRQGSQQPGWRSFHIQEGQYLEGIGSEGIYYSLLSYDVRDSGGENPLLVVFHGQGGTAKTYLDIWKKQAIDHRIVILSPEWFDNETGKIVDLSQLNLLIDHVCEQFSMSKEKVFLAGVSSGTLIASKLMFQSPSRWEGVFFIASPPIPFEQNKSQRESFPEVFFFHGEKDSVFGWEKTFSFAQDLKKRGLAVEFIKDPLAGHEHREAWNQIIIDRLRHS